MEKRKNKKVIDCINILQKRLDENHDQKNLYYKSASVLCNAMHGLVLCKSITTEIEVGASVDLNLKTFLKFHFA